MDVRVGEKVSDFSPEEWNALVHPNDPFSQHGFLLALELSGSVDEESGWHSFFASVRNEKEELIGALPLYAKDHSYGEYIFDWGWADASERAGIPYYPKLVSMIPFTPAAPGKRLLAKDKKVARALMETAKAVTKQGSFSSLHLNYLSQDEWQLAEDAEMILRKTMQFHWTNDGYKNFDSFLASLRSKVRKDIKRERRMVVDQNIQIVKKIGAQIEEEDWSFIHRMYRNTCEKKWGTAYLKRSFFLGHQGLYSENAVAFFAEREGKKIASSLSFRRGDTVCGRYWGCNTEAEALHFELCYYRLIEYAIDEGLARVEAGAQGSHKIKRGFLPSAIYSAHLIAHSALHDAVERATAMECREIDEVLGRADLSPFKKQNK